MVMEYINIVTDSKWEVGKCLATTVGKLFCKKGLWGKLGRLETRLREHSNMETNTIVMEEKGEVGKCLANTVEMLFRK